MVKKYIRKNIPEKKNKLANYRIMLSDNSCIIVSQNISCDGYFIMAESLKSLGKRDFAKCNKIGVVRLNELCKKLEEALKAKIVDII